MTRSKLINKVVELNPSLQHAQAEKVVSIIFEEITTALEKEERVELRGFGAFTVKKRSARVGRNPRTGDSVKVSEKHVPFFKSGKHLLDRLNGRR